MSVVLLPFLPHSSGGTIFISGWLVGLANFETDSLEAVAEQT